MTCYSHHLQHGSTSRWYPLNVLVDRQFAAAGYSKW
jgi:hypothetical protein